LSWDNAWYPPQGLFDWSAVQYLEIVAENAPLGSAEFYFDGIRIVDQTTAGLKGANQIPTSFRMSQNFPNPFNPGTTIEFSLPESVFTRLVIYDLRGRLVETLLAGKKAAGSHSVAWNSGNGSVEAGVYFARLDAGAHSMVIKMLLLK